MIEERSKFIGQPCFCKRCGRLIRLIVYKGREHCQRCWYLKQFRPQEYDPVAWESKMMKEAIILKQGENHVV